MKIAKFKPIKFSKSKLDIQSLSELCDVNWNYASSGKSALYHCLKSLNIKGTILVPSYICSSILVPIKELKLSYICYDIMEDDLNADICDIEEKLKSNNVEAVLVASMYGNPADLEQIEKLCKRYKVKLIDDAAQSFGAKIGDRYVGSFGNAGFFSFSPGKPTSGHMGGFFWTENSEYMFKRKNNFYLHYLSYISFYLNRYKIYSTNRYKIFKLLEVLSFFMTKIINTKLDKINNFEKPILGGIIKANFQQNFREREINYLIKNLRIIQEHQLVTANKDGTNNHKFVILYRNRESASFFYKQLISKSIYAINGYSLLPNSEYCLKAARIENKVIEIPVENSRLKTKYIIETLNKISSEYSSCNSNL